MENKEEFGTNYITLVDDEGIEQEFEIIDSLEIDGEYYYAFVPVLENAQDALEDSGELVILKALEEGGEEILSTINDDDEYDRVGAIFLERISNLFEESIEE